MHSRRQLALLAATTLVAVALLVAIIAGGPSSGRSGGGEPVGATASASGFDGAALPGDPPAPPFTLRGRDGRAVSLADYRGRVLVVSFVYAGCGGPCVVLAQQIRGALDELAAPAQTVFITADPAMDTPAHVAAFLSRVSLAGRAEYLTGSLERMRGIWRSYRIVPPARGRARFAQAASVLLIDRRGRERVLFGLEQLTPESLAHDIRRLQSG